MVHRHRDAHPVLDQVAAGGAVGDRIDRDVLFLGGLGGLRGIASHVGVAVREQHDRAWRGLVGMVGVGRGQQQRVQRGVDAVTDRGRRGQGQRIDGPFDHAAVLRRRHRGVDVAGEDDQRDVELGGQHVDEFLGRRLGRLDPAGRHVLGGHRARDVDRQDHGRPLARHHHHIAGLGVGDHQRAERQHCGTHRDVPLDRGILGQHQVESGATDPASPTAQARREHQVEHHDHGRDQQQPQPARLHERDHRGQHHGHLAAIETAPSAATTANASA
ncbi:hypothetical protein SDC9_162708 [bioreactor metagenome]|uniref:Uncharacterized protein n=1 Tax=bioreactor metagenome TaxID=1076179 RepID=A0A645FNU6_9ZZZZ